MPRKGKRVPVAPQVSPSVQAWAQRHPMLAANEQALAESRVVMLGEWKHREATAETQYRATHTKQGALARLFQAGAINADQLAWANEIAMTAEAIERDVAVRIVDYEPRIDHETRGGTVLLEGVMRVRREQAYGRWRSMLPMPKR